MLVRHAGMTPDRSGPPDGQDSVAATDGKDAGQVHRVGAAYGMPAGECG